MTTIVSAVITDVSSIEVVRLADSSIEGGLDPPVLWEVATESEPLSVLAPKPDKSIVVLFKQINSYSWYYSKSCQ